MSRTSKENSKFALAIVKANIRLDSETSELTKDCTTVDSRPWSCRIFTFTLFTGTAVVQFDSCQHDEKTT